MVTVHLFYDSSVSSHPPSSHTTRFERTLAPNTYQTQATSISPSSNSPSIDDVPPAPIPSTKIPTSRVNHYQILSPGPNQRPRSSRKPRDQSFKIHKGLPMPARALPEVTSWTDQCFHCGQFGHQQGQVSCPDANSPRTAEHYNDWRLVRFSQCGPTKCYSVVALWPNVMAIDAPPNVLTLEDNEANDTSTPMILDEYTPTSTVDQPPPIPWSTRPTTYTVPVELDWSSEVFVDAGCICACHD
ncbi:hypothetical protein DFH28DRAFT_904269 [Melampsora americana]|nr:hypothetical protein DFH28DRAFT_904269 [Melampsora americana]